MLRKARHAAGMSRQGLAAAIVSSPGCLSAIESEQRPPSIELADRMARALQLDPWHAALLQAVAVDEARLRSRCGVRHVHRRGTPVSPDTRARIRAERTAGRSWAAIAIGLNADGVPSMAGGSWWATSVRNTATEQETCQSGASTAKTGR
ncbi:helix-turn-helix domain-containing protein [Streptomyces murinus]|uniref:helix-turn-helix domain-containing protein n=1 Tax=Streptomyces murinus TaxID=33900 RepID=UPI0037BBEAAF